MLLKLLLTLLVIAGAVLTLRMRREREAAPSAAVSTRTSNKKFDTPIKIIAAGLAVLMLSGVGAYTYHLWQDSYRVVMVSVIDTRSGNLTQYEVYKGDVEGRQFITTDGRTVTLAEVERLELGAQ